MVARKKPDEELNSELAVQLSKDERIVETVRVSMAEIANGDTISFDEAFGSPGPR